MSEHKHQAALFDILRANEGKYPSLRWVFAIANGGARHPATARALKAEGVKKGIHDIFLPFPMNTYNGMFLEMKFGKNKLTPEQNEFGIFAAMQNYHTAVCYSWQDAAKEIENYLGIKLSK